MASHANRPGDFELATHVSDSEDFDLDEAEFDTNRLADTSYSHNGGFGKRLQSLISILLPGRLRQRGYRPLSRPKTHQTLKVRRRRRCCSWFPIGAGLLAAMVVLTSIFNPSYTQPPKHYQELRDRVQLSNEEGLANPQKEKVFIAASIYDRGGHLLRGAWGEAVLQLIDLLGNNNVFLSIYENNGDEDTATAQTAFREKVRCKHSIVYDRDFIMEDVPHVELPDGSRRVKRIAFLADVRNKALDPLEEEAATIQFDKILYLNDVIFDPIDAAQLLLSTNQGEDGSTSYRAACAVDFINPFKFYDTFASRDAEGFSMGVPFFPWFTSSGNGISRQDVLQGTDAVRVKSCWGGMVAFDAKPFQAREPLRFRSSMDLYWDASECCLIHADLAREGAIDEAYDFGIYMNPYVRVAYGERSLSWLHLTRRFERLYTVAHSIINRLVGLPWSNSRRDQQKGSMFDDKVWVPNRNLDTGGSFQQLEREAKGDGFCGRRGLQLLKQSPGEGDKNWENMPVPLG